ncbi:hypothetical protein [Microbacterium sp. PAMC21962]|uniref:hypothetical protein n=1 Tax=Microbacterium sp. PAMC21962 TaxID=2861280 RepID=UPI001C626A61|nr:hypothetical protein [Microbacterium sp. PAMC21962]QYF98470.1 hypothetical protein KY498_04285 [Microbacterium sp. PAMC21962]
MSDQMTSVHLPESGSGTFSSGFADHGRRDPAEMIARLRAIARRDLDTAQRIIDAPDEAFIVETYTGHHVQRNRVRLWPEQGDPS